MDPVESLSAEARACLDAFRREVPSEAAAEDGWRALQARLRRRSTAAPSPRRSGRVVVLAAAILAAAAVAFVFSRAATRGVLAQAVEEPGLSEAVDRAEGAQARGVASRETPRLASPPEGHPAPSDLSPRLPPPSEPASSRAPPSAATPPPTVDAPVHRDEIATTLAEETRLIEHARAALTRDATNEALSKLLEHAERFPNGTFVEERMAYMAIARCRAMGGHQDEARLFVRRWPQSPHRPRVEHACNVEKTSTDSGDSREQGDEAP